MEKQVKIGQTTDGNKIRLMRFACWTNKDTNRQSEYAMLTKFPQQEWLRVRTSMLGYNYIALLFRLFFW